MSSKSILIAGGGVIGLCAAYYCRARGHQVTILDRAAADHQGCSYGNAGLVVPSHFIPLAAPGMVALGLKWMWNPESPFHIKPRLDLALLDWAFKFWRAANPVHVQRCAPLLLDLNAASKGCFAELAREMDGAFSLEQKGLLMLCKTSKVLEKEINITEFAKRLGLRAEILDASEAARFEPDVQMDIAGAVYFPDDAHLTPATFMTELKRRLEASGVHFQWNTEVTGWRANGNRIQSVQTGRGDFSADEYLVCSGAWSPLIVRELGLKLPMQAGKGYSLTLPTPPQLPRIPAILTEARVAVTPMNDQLRFGGTMEIAGINEEINPARIRGMVKAIPQYYPSFTSEHFERIEPWCGLRPCTPDGLPYLGRPRRFTNLSVAAGHAMMGLSLGPITGKLMAEILSGEQPSIDIRLLDPDRYT
jgi:D-amino-acid dehydrogenase